MKSTILTNIYLYVHCCNEFISNSCQLHRTYSEREPGRERAGESERERERELERELERVRERERGGGGGGGGQKQHKINTVRV